MNTQDILDRVANIQKEMNEKALHMLRKHLQSKLFSPLFQREMQKLEEDLEKNLPMTAERRDEAIAIMMDDLEASNQKPVIKTVPAAKKVIRAVGASPKAPEKKAPLQSNKTDNSSEIQTFGFPPGAFAKMVEMFEKATQQTHQQFRTETPFLPSQNMPTFSRPCYTPPGFYAKNAPSMPEPVQPPATDPRFHFTGADPRFAQPNPVFNPEQAPSYFKPYTRSLEEQLRMEGWQVEQLRTINHNRHNTPAAYPNPLNPQGQTGQTDALAGYKTEPSSFRSFSLESLYSTELGKFTTIDDMEQYVIEQNRLISKTAAARLLNFQTFQLDDITNPNQKSYDPTFPKPILFSNLGVGITVKFRIGDILKYLKAKR